MTILILTHAQDIATDLVIRHLEKRGADFVRFNTDEFPQKVKLTIRFEDMGWKGQIKLPDRCLDTDEISAIWNRRPHRPIIDSAVTDPTLRTWGQEEAWHTLCIFWSMLRDRFWLNPIEEGIYIENNKWLQIIEAQRVGLMVPNLSLLSNDPVAIKSFCLEIGELAMKRIKSGLLKYPREGTGASEHQAQPDARSSRREEAQFKIRNQKSEIRNRPRLLTSAATIEGDHRAAARRPGLDRDEVPGERSHAPLRNSQRPRE